MLSQRTPRSSPLMNIMVAAVEKAGKSLIRDFGEVECLQSSSKGLERFASVSYEKSARILEQELFKYRPSFSLRSPEKEHLQDPNNTWILNPLDGKINFLHAIPQFSICLAAESYGEIVIGIIFNPITDELFWAEKGKGAFLNQRRLRVSHRTSTEDFVLGTKLSGGEIPASFKGMHVRSLGATSLDIAYLAAGRYDLFIDDHLSTLISGPGLILTQEAGGYLADFQGKKYTHKDIILGAEKTISSLFLENLTLRL